jgi:hypothetical protein
MPVLAWRIGISYGGGAPILGVRSACAADYYGNACILQLLISFERQLPSGLNFAALKPWQAFTDSSQLLDLADSCFYALR